MGQEGWGLSLLIFLNEIQALSRAHTYYTTQSRGQGLIFKHTIGVVCIGTLAVTLSTLMELVSVYNVVYMKHFVFERWEVLNFFVNRWAHLNISCSSGDCSQPSCMEVGSRG